MVLAVVFYWQNLHYLIRKDCYYCLVRYSGGLCVQDWDVLRL